MTSQQIACSPASRMVSINSFRPACWFLSVLLWQAGSGEGNQTTSSQPDNSAASSRKPAHLRRPSAESRPGARRTGSEACSFQTLALRSPQCRQDPCLFRWSTAKRHGSCSFMAKKKTLRGSQGGRPLLPGYGMRFPAALYSPYHSARVRGRAEPAQLSSRRAGLVVPSTT